MPDEEPKIIVDDDWKKQAQAEKEQLDQQTKTEGSSEPGAPGDAPSEPGQPQELPPADFATLVSSLMGQAMMAMGGVEDPESKQRYVNLDQAKFSIDLLSMLEEKTKGNLTDDEAKMIDETIYRMRMLYVELAQRVSQI